MKQGLHGKHCSRYLADTGRYCDKPAEVCQGRRYFCADHDPYKLNLSNSSQEQHANNDTKP